MAAGADERWKATGDFHPHLHHAKRAQEFPILVAPTLILLFGHRRIARFSLLDTEMQVQEQVVQIAGPGLPMLFEKENQFAQQMTLAEGMQAVLKAQVAGQEVMHQPTRKSWNDPGRLDGVLAAREVDREERQQGRAQHVQPMADLIDHDAGFIGMEDRFLGQDLNQPLFKRLQRLILLLAGALQRGFTHRLAEHFGTHFPDPPTGPFLGVVEAGQQGAEVLPILDGSLGVSGKGRHPGAMAARTLLDFGSVLRTFQFQRKPRFLPNRNT
jgi:hypothetical protein